MTRYDDMMQKMTVEEMARIIAGGPQPCLRCAWWKEGCGDKLCEEGVKKWLMEEKDIKAYSGWIPVSERMPEEYNGASVPVLVTVERQLEGDKFVTMAFTMNGHWSCFEAEITAWMPLPEPFERGGANDC